MEISFISSLDAEEEERIASVLIAAVSALLDETSFPYTVRIKTSGLKLFQRSHPGILHHTPDASVVGAPGAGAGAHRGRPPLAK
jgi:hypothetical protein